MIFPDKTIVRSEFSMNSIPRISSLLICFLLFLFGVSELGFSQRRTREVTTGTMRIELLGRSAVNQATIHLFLNDSLVATQSVKKDSAADRARLANIQNLEPGKYTLRIEAPGKPNLEKMAYVRAERTPVKMYIDFPAGRGFVGESGESVSEEQIELMMATIQNLQRRVRDLERGEIRMNQIDEPASPAAPDTSAQPQPEMSRFQRWWRGNNQPEPETETEPSRRQSRRERRNAERQPQPETESNQPTPTVEQAERNARQNARQNIGPPIEIPQNNVAPEQNQERRGILSRFKRNRTPEPASP